MMYEYKLRARQRKMRDSRKKSLHSRRTIRKTRTNARDESNNKWPKLNPNLRCTYTIKQPRVVEK